MKYREATALVRSDPRPFVYEVRFTDTGSVYVGHTGQSGNRVDRLNRTRNRGNRKARDITIHFCESLEEAIALEERLIRYHQLNHTPLLNKYLNKGYERGWGYRSLS